jgi:ABC-type nitrate/sulfonate/bicarbonate transport system substrate-binding protein
MALDKVSFPYRSSSHLVFLHVVAESGSWAKHDLDVNYNFPIMKNDAHRMVASGEVEFVGGNHISTYGHRARGDDWVYLGQTVNCIQTKLCVKPDSGINGVDDLRGKRVGTRGNHPGLNDWLFLKQRGLDVDRDDYELVKEVDGEMSSEAQPEDGSVREPAKKKKRAPVWQWVRDGKVDAALLTPPSSLFAEAAGLKLIDIEPLPMIWFTTISSSLRFVRSHPNLVERFLKGIVEGVHFFKTEWEKSIRIIQERYANEGQMNYEQAAFCWQNTAAMLEPRLYPSMQAILNVYEEAKRSDKDAIKVNPMALWDLHHVRRIDDSGFIDQLYGSNSGRDRTHAHDPDYATEKAAEQHRIIDAVKACGHLESEHCECD